MLKLGLAGGISLMLLGALLVGACGDDDEAGVAHDGAGGNPSQGGSSSGSAGLGGSDAGAGGEQGGACPGPLTLADFCGRGGCPQSPSDVELACGGSARKTTVRRRSSCGGVAIVVGSDYGGSVWHFNADGDLVGIQSSSDAVTDCTPPGGIYYSGERCSVSGPTVNLCESVTACGPYPLTDYCDAHDCPSSLSDLERDTFLADRCGIDSVTRYASSCGGSVVRVGDGTLYSETWSFNVKGDLNGFISKGDLEDACDEGGRSNIFVYGDPCDPQGAGENLCPVRDGMGGAGGAGGAGAAGEAGAGGSAGSTN